MARYQCPKCGSWEVVVDHHQHVIQCDTCGETIISSNKSYHQHKPKEDQSNEITA